MLANTMSNVTMVSWDTGPRRERLPAEKAIFAAGFPFSPINIEIKFQTEIIVEQVQSNSTLNVMGSARSKDSSNTAVALVDHLSGMQKVCFPAVP